MVHQMMIDWIVDAFKEVDHVRLGLDRLLSLEPIDAKARCEQAGLAC
jgi:hypothetical protein